METTITNQAPAINTPSISSAAVLVELSISTWTGRKLEKTVSNEITATKHAQKGTANVNKKILGDCAELDAVQKFAANVRNAHYAMDYPHNYDLPIRWQLLIVKRVHSKRYRLELDRRTARYFPWAKVSRIKHR